MMLRIDSLLVLLAASAAMAGLPGDGVAQPATRVKSAPEVDASPGQRLESRARKMADRGRGGWAQAADLYARAARTRGAGDWGAADDLVMAGHLYFHAAEHASSVVAFRAAGQLYLASGRLEAAARAFRDGAWVAGQAGSTLDAQELREWAEVLSRPQPQGQQGRRRLFVGGRRS